MVQLKGGKHIKVPWRKKTGNVPHSPFSLSFPCFHVGDFLASYLTTISWWSLQMGSKCNAAHDCHTALLSSSIADARSLSDILAEQIDLEILIRHKELQEIDQQIQRAETTLSIIVQSNEYSSTKTPVKARHDATKSPFTPPYSNSPKRFDTTAAEQSISGYRGIKEKKTPRMLTCPGCKRSNFRNMVTLLAHYRRTHDDNHSAKETAPISCKYDDDHHIVSPLPIPSKLRNTEQESSLDIVGLYCSSGADKFSTSNANNGSQNKESFHVNCPQFLKSFLESQSSDIDITAIYNHVTEPINNYESNSTPSSNKGSGVDSGQYHLNLRPGHPKHKITKQQQKRRNLTKQKCPKVPRLVPMASNIPQRRIGLKSPDTLLHVHQGRKTLKYLRSEKIQSTVGLMERTVLSKSRFYQKLFQATVNRADLLTPTKSHSPFSKGKNASVGLVPYSSKTLKNSSCPSDTNLTEN
ncbi:hypothetical protein NEOLI_000228 [Neolecta irregularis DAH-3]|uniref:Uncharacterized protein n=1 Tax=Neolecta irregularis (strain DAH-3) TaxID=1198029 RepID=A0A1U7LK46_NEOID|nr:hypothetical protein NEOLI_000228 [Neolecta irregularis DAH-3]|eukprot:OLL22922.1 hypothetical protein NEOLI_000228 [Neolecta irregularis DAH-3]